MAFSQKIENYIGIMSGTSMDGIDAVCVQFINNQYKKILAYNNISYSKDLKNQLLSLQDIQFNELDKTYILSNILTAEYIKIVQNLIRENRLNDIKAIGCHGQTIRHNPVHGYSIQIANWAKLAEETKITVVGDFRQTDIAANGQGAPLVTSFHSMLFKTDKFTRVIVNIGGIANITILKAKIDDIIGFDTGPGNMLLDSWCNEKFSVSYDIDGNFSKQGKIIDNLLKSLLKEEYFSLPAPKSTGRDLFSISWLKKHLNKNENDKDVARTLLELTAITITDAIKNYAKDVKEVIICGGGANNLFLVERIQDILKSEISVYNTNFFGIDTQHVEAAAFAWFAMCRINGIYSNYPKVTGSKGKRILGAVWQPFKSNFYENNNKKIRK